MDCITDRGEDSRQYGWLFEQYAHETFQQGGQFELVSLLEDEKEELVLNPEIGHYEILLPLNVWRKYFKTSI